MHHRQLGFVITAIGLVAGTFGCSQTELADGAAPAAEEEAVTSSICPAGVPASLAPAADQTIKSKLNGVGVQIYMCNGLAAGPAWTFVAPQANLLRDDGRMLGTHFIGPTWQGNDESSVSGAKAAGASVDATALPWLLLNVTGHGTDDGYFSDVTAIQRLATVGGNAPATGCDAEHLGAIVQVPYSAEYVFYKTKTHGRIQQCNGS
jgi:hypothetical protein